MTLSPNLLREVRPCGLQLIQSTKGTYTEQCQVCRKSLQESGSVSLCASDDT